jgi:hypothetical protein
MKREAVVTLAKIADVAKDVQPTARSGLVFLVLFVRAANVTVRARF